MNNIAKLSGDKRKELFVQTAAKDKRFTPAIVEKDFWVCWTLNKLFSSKQLRQKLIFKGGTSLSKIFNLIERFSEDIDLILNWQGLTDEDPMQPRSKTQQDKFNTKLDKAGESFIRNELFQSIRNLCGGICEVEISQENPNVILIKYPAAFPYEYLRPEILLEIGPKAAWVPHASYETQSYAAIAYPDIFKEKKVNLIATTPERSFWEKVTILHAEAHRPENKLVPLRYSRHYYDTAQMANSKVKDAALDNLDLLAKVVEFKQRFYHAAHAHYHLARPGTLKLLPAKRSRTALQDDYKKMRVMIYGIYPSFSEIMDKLALLENEINNPH
jgi:hypothetical protein